jgi:carboxypeptidase family protein
MDQANSSGPGHDVVALRQDRWTAGRAAPRQSCLGAGVGRQRDRAGHGRIRRHGIPGATVTLAADRWSQTSVTDLVGRYRIEGVPAGVYTVWFAIRGFDTAAFQTVAVHGESPLQLDATLKLTTWCDHCATALVERHEVAVIFETMAGTFIIAVDAAHAPITSANFLDFIGRRVLRTTPSPFRIGRCWSAFKPGSTRPDDPTRCRRFRSSVRPSRRCSMSPAPCRWRGARPTARDPISSSC